jgi:hypothetical protein
MENGYPSQDEQGTLSEQERVANINNIKAHTALLHAQAHSIRAARNLKVWCIATLGIFLGSLIFVLLAKF